eukprot:4982585-Ditylum_brightwellii.AAC.1
MQCLPTGWETDHIERLTTLAREYLATVLSNRERNKLQQEIVKKETSSSTEKKTTDKNPKTWQGGKGKTELTPHQKDIFKEISQGKHTAEKKKYWHEQTATDRCYFYRNKNHPSSECKSTKNAIQKAKDDGVTQGQETLSTESSGLESGQPAPAARRVTQDLSDNPFDIL